MASAPQATYDLHLHTRWSYDAMAPAEYYFRSAHETKLRCIAVSDHFHMDAMPEVREAARRYPEVAYLPGAEMTVATSIGAVDLVCLGLPPKSSPAMEEIFQTYRQWQRRMGEAYSAGLQAMGYDFSETERMALLRRYRPGEALRKHGATHVMGPFMRRHCVERGWAEDESQSQRLLAQAGERGSAPPYPQAADVLPVLRRAGAMISIAHPTHYFRHGNRARMEALTEELQLDGIECAHDAVPPELTKTLRDFCREKGLFSTAGSDTHLDPDDNPLGLAIPHRFRRHRGEDAWLDELLERLTPLHGGD